MGKIPSQMASPLSRFRRHSFSITLMLLSILAVATTSWGARGFIKQCSGLQQPPPEVRMQGAGATFPNPIYQKWFHEYTKSNPGVLFNYQSIGSVGGIVQITEKTIDFGGSDAPMNDDQLAKVQGQILHIPTVLGAIVLTYNVPGVAGNLKFTPEIIAGIYLGKIKKWDDPAIASVNAGVKLPANDIIIVHRSDGSGSTLVFTDYLSKVSQEWQAGPGAATSINWPLGVGAKGNEGTSRMVQQTPNAIGYVDFIYAEQNKLLEALVENSAGEFVRPSVDSITAAAAATPMPDDLRVSLTNAPGREAYPIAAFTYLLVYKHQSGEAKGKALVSFLRWAIHEGQHEAPDLDYAPLPDNVIEKVEELINSITLAGSATDSKRLTAGAVCLNSSFSLVEANRL